MLATMLVDADHVFAEPIYDANRCSIGYHPLHEPVVLPVYILMLFYPKTRYLGVGLVVHMVLDSIDCQFTNGIWFV